MQRWRKSIDDGRRAYRSGRFPVDLGEIAYPSEPVGRRRWTAAAAVAVAASVALAAVIWQARRDPPPVTETVSQPPPLAATTVSPAPDGPPSVAQRTVSDAASQPVEFRAESSRRAADRLALFPPRRDPGIQILGVVVRPEGQTPTDPRDLTDPWLSQSFALPARHERKTIRQSLASTHMPASFNRPRETAAGTASTRGFGIATLSLSPGMQRSTAEASSGTRRDRFQLVPSLRRSVRAQLRPRRSSLPFSRRTDHAT